MFKKILFPINSLENSKSTITYVKDLAKKYSSEVVVLSLLDLSVISGSPLIFSLNEDQEENILFAYQYVIDQVKEEIEKEGLKVTSKLKKGKPGPLICKVAEEENCDLIIMAKRDLGTIKSYLLGSVSNYVIHNSKCPIFLIDTEFD
ncbi:MAG: universal stress protein [Candidatus Sericytochromatia bacterium]|nr:universal stress protein [Candidatus Sericytochromatia bacterium]